MSNESILYDILSYAIKHNEYGVFDTNYTNVITKSYQNELFHQACIWNQVNMIDIMFKRGFNIEDGLYAKVSISHTEEKTYQVPIIFECLAYGAFNVMNFLLSHGLSPNAVHPNNGMTALFYAGVRLGLGNREDFSYMESLLKHGADVNLKNSDGQTLLHAFCKSAPLNIFLHKAKILIDYGANPNIQDELGNTPLHYVQARYEKYGIPKNTLYFFQNEENPIQIDFSLYNKHGVKLCVC